ncbi:MAG: hypothetical protein AAGH41_03020 [Pseudomonadota bacterium]
MVRRFRILVTDAVFLVALAILGMAIMRVAEGSGGESADPIDTGMALSPIKPLHAPLAEGEKLVSARVAVDRFGPLILPGDQVMVTTDGVQRAAPIGPVAVASIEPSVFEDELGVVMTFAASREQADPLLAMRSGSLLRVELAEMALEGAAEGLDQLGRGQVMVLRMNEKPLGPRARAD